MTKAGKGLLLITAFFEGGALMAAELLGSKFIAPYYGNSIYVWAGVLGITLAGLAAGYFSGSALAEKNQPEKKLFLALLAGATAMILMPSIQLTVVAATLSMEIRAGIVISSISLLLVPLFCFGMVSPLVIRCLSSHKYKGSATGNVYAISTAGGIVFTVITGFVLIPHSGLIKSAYGIGLITCIFPLIFFVRSLLTSSSAQD